MPPSYGYAGEKQIPNIKKSPFMIFNFFFVFLKQCLSSLSLIKKFKSDKRQPKSIRYRF